MSDDIQISIITGSGQIIYLLNFAYFLCELSKQRTGFTQIYPLFKIMYPGTSENKAGPADCPQMACLYCEESTLEIPREQVGGSS